MFKDFSDEDLRKWIKNNYPYKEMSEEEINQKIIEYFGPEKLKELEFTLKIDNLNFKLADFLKIEVVPVFYESIPEDARFYDKEDYIGISNKFMFDEIESIKCLIHEVRHYYQKYCISHKTEKLKFAPIKLIEEWENDFKKNQQLMEPSEQMCLAVEIDAYAFTKYILKEWFNYEYHHNDLAYDTVLGLYISKYYK